MRRSAPGTVLGGLALLVALGGTSYAAVVLPANSVGSRQVIDGSLQKRDLRPGLIPTIPKSETRLWAVINPSGSISRSSGTTSAGHVITGGYEVIFSRDIAVCAYFATIGNAAQGNPLTGQIAVAPRTGLNTAVYVETRDSAGVLTDLPFHLQVIC